MVRLLEPGTQARRIGSHGVDFRSNRARSKVWEVRRIIETMLSALDNDRHFQTVSFTVVITSFSGIFRRMPQLCFRTALR